MSNINREALRKNMEFICMGIMAGTDPYNAPLTEIDNAPEASPKGEWIPIKTRPVTQEDREEHPEWEDDEAEYMFDCPMPDDNQQILICTRWGIDIDVCTRDPDYGIGLEERGDWDGVLAWMPLPEPYKPEEET